MGQIYTVYADGASRGNPGPASAGAVITNASGDVVHEVSEYLGEETNNYAEYMAVIRSLEYLVSVDDVSSASIFLDSKLVVEQASGRWKVKSENVKPLHAQLQKLILEIGVPCNFSHVFREKNTIADALANAALDARG